MPIQAGIPAPDFSLLDEQGITRRLTDYLGRTLVLYFYPKDDTPGCTTEACNFRDDYSAYVNADVMILGISPDDVKSHASFKQKHNLPFPLLADAGHQVSDQYGVWGPKKFMGRDYDGILRTTFLIDKKGRVARVFENVRPADHSVEVLAALELV